MSHVYAYSILMVSNIFPILPEYSKRYQLDGKVCKEKSLLEHTFYLLSEQKVKEAYELIKQKSSQRRRNTKIFPTTSVQGQYEKNVLDPLWKDLVKAYIGVLAYTLWYYTTGKQNSASM